MCKYEAWSCTNDAITDRILLGFENLLQIFELGK